MGYKFVAAIERQLYSDAIQENNHYTEISMYNLFAL